PKVSPPLGATSSRLGTASGAGMPPSSGTGGMAQGELSNCSDEEYSVTVVGVNPIVSVRLSPSRRMNGGSVPPQSRTVKGVPGGMVALVTIYVPFRGASVTFLVTISGGVASPK